FLAESPDFADICRACGITCIGPFAESIRLMGDKAQAREFAKAAGVPVVPGSQRPLQDVTEAVEVADRVGYPVIFKAAAGGGGRGMRLVREREAAPHAFAACESGAAAALGAPACHCEKDIAEGRHRAVRS